MAGQAFHAPVIRGVPGMELACILERRGTRAQEKYPEVRVARTLDQLLADKEIQLCVIATPNDSHFALAQACLLAGRDVVVDKPFAPTLAESERLVRLAAERGRLITVYQDRRWDGDFGTVKKLVQSGRLGTIVEYECRYDRFRLEPKANAWREKADQPGAGVLFDWGPMSSIRRWDCSASRGRLRRRRSASGRRRRWTIRLMFAWNIHGFVRWDGRASWHTRRDHIF
jgi:predicted dehydrogenase